jgi:hypothetical protein
MSNHCARLVLFHRLNGESYEEAKNCKRCAELAAKLGVDEIVLEDRGALPLTEGEEEMAMKSKKKPAAKAKPVKKKK